MIAASVATLALIVLGDATTGPMGGPSLGFAFVLLIGLPATLLSWQALKRNAVAHVWRSTGALALMAVGYGLVLLAIGALAVFSGDLGSDPGQTLGAVVTNSVEEAAGEGMTPPDPATIVAMSKLLTEVPAVVLAMWLTLLTAMAALSQALLIRFEHAIRPTPMMADLSLPRWYSAVALVLLIGASALPGPYGLIAANILVIQSFALFLAGLAVLHAGTQRVSQRLLILIAIYAVMLLFAPVALLFAVIGWAEPWLGLRTRLGRLRSPD
jgi:hypothetical protein